MGRRRRVKIVEESEEEELVEAMVCRGDVTVTVSGLIESGEDMQEVKSKMLEAFGMVHDADDAQVEIHECIIVESAPENAEVLEKVTEEVEDMLARNKEVAEIISLVKSRYPVKIRHEVYE
jgi:hypothetical protein